MKAFFEISGKAPFYGLIGNPCRHSLSPMLHRLLGEAIEEDTGYYLAEPGSDRLQELLYECRSSGCKGLNVTVPFKESICPYIDCIDPMAKAVGAVNTVSFTSEGLKGDNTDVYGFLKELEELQLEPLGKSVLVLGAGGASRAVLYALLSEGASVYLWNRDPAKARRLEEAYLPYGGDVRAVCSDDIASLSYDWIVSTLPQEAENGVLTALRLFDGKIPEFVLSVAYSGRISPFKAICKEKSVPYADGLAMLFYQGLRSREIWTGKKLSPETVMTLRQRFQLKAEQKLVLIGFMATGKSTLGKQAADQLGKSFLDLDSQIEIKTGKSITKLFEEEGENSFRRLESEALRDALLLEEPCVIACGGGSVIATENRQLLQQANCLTVWLDCKPDTRRRRLQFSRKRPLTKGKKAHEIEALYESRLAAYENAADCRLMMDGPVKQNLKELLTLWKQSLS